MILTDISVKSEDRIVYDCVVIGGGLSGTTFAHYLRSVGKNVLIIEKQDRIGGCMHTSTSSIYHDYWNELGSHTCYNSYTKLLSVVKEIGCEDILLPLEKQSYVTYDSGKVCSMFSQISILPIAFRCWNYFFSNKTDKTVKEYFAPIVGLRNYNLVFTRLFRAVICQEPDEYPAQLFMKKRKEKAKDQPRRFTFKSGMEALPTSIVEKDHLNVVRSNEVVKIKRLKNEQIYKILTLEGGIFYAKKLAIATDPQTAASLLNGIDNPISEILNEIGTSCCDSFSVLVNADKLKVNKVAGIIPLSDDFMSVVSRDVIGDNKHNIRSFTFHFSKGTKTDSEKIDIICDVLKISQNDILESRQVSHILPALTIDDVNMAGNIATTRTDDNIFILGNYFYGLSLEDCVNRSFDEFQRFCQIDSNTN